MNVTYPKSHKNTNEVREVTVQELTLDAPILVLAPHPDDESLGCGALLAAAFEGAGASVVCVTDGSGSHPGSTHWSKARLAAERRKELINAVSSLGGQQSDVSWLDFVDGEVPSDPDGIRPAVERLVQHCHARGIRRVFTSSAADAHADHKATALIAQALCRDATSLSLLAYPVWSRWENWQKHGVNHLPGTARFDATRWLSRKREAIACHRSQLGQLIDDDPGGFVMPPQFVAMFETGDEWFSEVEQA